MILFGVVCLFLIPALSLAARTGSCFTFEGGNGYLKFSNSSMSLHHSASYKLTFKSKTSYGLIFYAKGPHGDYEGLFLLDGKLHYLLINPTEHGIGGTFGIHKMTNERLSINTKYSVQFFRNKEVSKTVRGQTINETISGMIVDKIEYIDTDIRVDVAIHPEVFLGGADVRVSQIIPNFRGEIWDFVEEKNRVSFSTPSSTVNVKRC